MEEIDKQDYSTLVQVRPRKDLGRMRIIVPAQQLGLDEKAIILELEIIYFWYIFELTQKIGEEGVQGILAFVSMVEDIIIVDLLKQQSHEDRLISAGPRQVAHTICLEVSKFNIPKLKTGRRRQDERLERVSQFTYNLITNYRIGYERAAQIAGILLDKEMSDEAWRKYINRWATRQGLEKPDLRRKEG